MRGVTLPAGRIAAPGVIHVDALGPTWIGPFEPSPARARRDRRPGRASDAQRTGDPRARDARGAQWTKLLFNAATNPLCALTGLTHGELCAHPPTRRLVGELLREGAGGRRRARDRARRRPGRARRRSRPGQPAPPAQHAPGRRRRRPTEIATLNGGIVDAGRVAGVPTPQHEAIVALIRRPRAQLGGMIGRDRTSRAPRTFRPNVDGTPNCMQ